MFAVGMFIFGNRPPASTPHFFVILTPLGGLCACFYKMLGYGVGQEKTRESESIRSRSRARDGEIESPQPCRAREDVDDVVVRPETEA